MCNEPVGPDHGHVVALDSRAIMCTCRACSLLFTRGGAGAGRYRPIPTRYALDESSGISAETWASLQIPVGMAFVFVNSDMDRPVAMYPSPGGATESLLPLGTWSEIVESSSLLQTMEPDVEAALFRKTDAGFDCFLVPIDVCYELVGRVRRSWKGFDGGTEMWDELTHFFENIGKKAGV